jgi:cation-transporting ATPase I
VGPIDRLEYRMTSAGAEMDLQLTPRARFGVAHDHTLVGVFDTAPVLRVGAHELVEESRRNGLLVALASSDRELFDRLGADVLLDADVDLLAAVRRLQTDGQTVAVLCGPAHRALAAADLSVGLITDHDVPWGAHVMITELDQARFVSESIAVAREVSRQGNALTLAGSSVASIFALTSPVRTAGARVTNTINVASLVAMANSTRAAIGLARSSPQPAIIPPRWHELSRNEVLRTLGTDLAGLPSAEADRRRGPTERVRPRPLALATAITAEMANPLTPILAGSAILSASVGSVADAGIVFSVIALNGIISGVQRFGAEQAVRSLSSATSIHAHVRRDGDPIRLPGASLVPGDIVLFEAGDAVPADCRILRANSLEVDESSLTGESEPVTKSWAASFASLITERSCMLYAGTDVVAGSAVGVVVAIGSDTEAYAHSNGAQEPPAAGGVEARLRDLSTVSLPVAGASGVILAASQLLRGQPIQSALGSGVSVAVAAVPEGLPMLATVGQLAAARRLSRRGVLVRNPRAIEALGRVDVLCVDKTGTLTRGHVELRVVSDGRTSLGVDGLTGRHRDILAAARRASPERNGQRSLPHFTDRAVLDAADAQQIADDEGASGWQRIAELAFGADRPYHATIGSTPDGGRISTKGAPEALVERCTAWMRQGHTVPLDGTARAALRRHVEDMARRGFRLLAVAERATSTADGERLTDEDLDGSVLLGFLALADPVRDTAAEAVAELQRSGIEMVMVTGDHPSTAEGIAAELGILNGRRVLTGPELEDLTDPELDTALPDVSVFARVTPTHKVRIVAAYQRVGRAVAMTGDGANDANAIRLADAGIALGRHCAPAARAAADVIITDDRIETIVQTIIEGRALWASIRDALAILLGGNLGEIGFILATGGLVGRPALNPRQVLLVNLLTDVAPSLAIAARPPAARTPEQLAREGPERSLGGQLDEAIIQRAAATALGATSAWLVARATGSPKRASTVGLLALVGTQLGQTLAIGHRDPLVVAAALGSAGVLAVIVQTPGVSQFFGCRPLGPIGWATAIMSSTGATIGAAVLPAPTRRLAHSLLDRISPPETEVVTTEDDGPAPRLRSVG